MSGLHVLTALIFVQIALNIASAQGVPTLPPEGVSIENISRTGEPGYYIQFPNDDCRYGPSDNDGWVKFDDCRRDALTVFADDHGHLDPTPTLPPGGLYVMDGNWDGSPGHFIQFPGDSCRSGPSLTNGWVQYDPCTEIRSIPTVFRMNHVHLNPAAFQRASLVADDSPVLTVVLKNAQDTRNRNSIVVFMESASGAAIFVAIITGFFGTLITHFLQKRKYQHDLDLQAEYKIAEEDRLRLAKDLESERDLVRSAYQLVGRCIAAGENLLAIATPEFQSKTPDQKLEHAKEKLRAGFDETEETWKVERYSTDLLIKLYHPGQNQIQRIWGDIDGAIASYFEICTQKYNEYRDSKFKELVSLQDKAAIKREYALKIVDALTSLTAEIAKVRQPAARPDRSAADAETAAG